MTPHSTKPSREETRMILEIRGGTIWRGKSDFSENWKGNVGFSLATLMPLNPLSVKAWLAVEKNQFTSLNYPYKSKLAIMGCFHQSGHYIFLAQIAFVQDSIIPRHLQKKAPNDISKHCCSTYGPELVQICGNFLLSYQNCSLIIVSQDSFYAYRKSVW